VALFEPPPSFGPVSVKPPSISVTEPPPVVVNVQTGIARIGATIEQVRMMPSSGNAARFT
jgi:hypothetical protein